MSYTYQPPDLATILRNLANCVPQPQTPPPPPAVTTGIVPHAQTSAPDNDEDSYEPPDIVADIPVPAATPPVTTQATHFERTFSPHVAARTATPTPASTPLSRTQSQHSAPRTPTPTPVHPTQVGRMGTPIVDATVITEWSAGLKCVMRTVAQSEAIMTRIKRMIEDQHINEKRWWAGRQELLKKQESRIEGKKKVDDILRSVGGIVPSTAISNPTSDLAELRTYDLKVHKASAEMVRAMTAELKAMGIPFFGTRGGTGARITERELLALQRRMLEVLEDLCRD